MEARTRSDLEVRLHKARLELRATAKSRGSNCAATRVARDEVKKLQRWLG